MSVSTAPTYPWRSVSSTPIYHWRLVSRAPTYPWRSVSSTLPTHGGQYPAHLSAHGCFVLDTYLPMEANIQQTHQSWRSKPSTSTYPLRSVSSTSTCPWSSVSSTSACP
jgi:hypothetical protein